MRRTGYGVVVACLLAVSGGGALGEEPGGLDGRLRPLIEGHKGDVSVVVKNLKTGERYDYRADEPMPTASLIKFPVMVEVYAQVAEGRLKLEDRVTLREEDKVPGSGILTEDFDAGLEMSLRDAVRLMIKFSDNTATNLVLDRVGIDATAKRMEGLGYPETKVHSKVYRRSTSMFPERSERFGLGSTTAGEMVRLCEALEKGELVSKEACEAMVAHMETCDDVDKFPRFLPAGTRLAFKTGSVNAARTAAGVMWTEAGPIALCVMTAENEDQSWTPENAGDRLCAEVAREVFAYCQEQAAREPVPAGAVAQP